MSEQKRTLLVIDDDTSLLVTLSDFLRFEGYEVITAESGEKGLVALNRVKPDLIILDMSMPGMGGIGFLKEIVNDEGTPEYPVLVLTARANMAEFFANVEVDGFVAKPCDPQDLLMEVTRIIFLRQGDDAVTRNAVSQRRVVLGESDIGFASRLVDAYRDQGFVIEHCLKGPEVLESAIVNQPDVIVMNQILDGLNGSAVADMLKVMPNTKSIPILIFADDADELRHFEPNRDGGGVVAAIQSSSADEIVKQTIAIFN